MKRGNGMTILFVVIILALIGYIVYTHMSSTTAVQAPATTPPVTKASTVTTPKASASTWKAYTDGYGFGISHPPYTTVGADSKSTELDKNPTALAYHDLIFSPDPNADFATFSSVIEVDKTDNFILDLPDRFIAFNPATSAWFANTNLDDKPSGQHKTYQNLYLPNNQFTPPIYSHTTSGLYIYGPFLLGDTNRGTANYLIPVLSKSIIIDVKYTYNADALAGSSQTIKSLKAQFDKDLPTMLKSISAS